MRFYNILIFSKRFCLEIKRKTVFLDNTPYLNLASASTWQFHWDTNVNQGLKKTQFQMGLLMIKLKMLL
mgnify:CR=1 FL=1